MTISGKITGIHYTTKLNKHLDKFSLEGFDINSAPSACIVYDNESQFAISKWVSPKRSRSYPYDRVYNTLTASKRITVIPIVKDEGIDGDRDLIQWDTISLMSLLDTFVIFAYYTSAKKSKRGNKITSQNFDKEYVNTKITEIKGYLSSALHWNLKELAAENLSQLISTVKSSYKTISAQTGVIMHSDRGIDNFATNITDTTQKFIEYSREKARAAQTREIATIQPKESLTSITKAKITITNYLGGEYYFTVDETKKRQNCIYLIEDKHSKADLLPSDSDIKDGLLKMILYSNLCNVCYNGTKTPHRAVLRLTSTKLIGEITSESSKSDIERFFTTNSINTRNQKRINLLFEEANINNFIVLIEHSL